MLLRSHIAKYHGVNRIRQAMTQKGLSKEVISQAIDESDCDWYALAREKAIKKYRIPKTNDYKEKSRRIRHMVGQGFDFDQVAFALDYDPLSEEY